MARTLDAVLRILREDSGLTAVEYAVLLSLTLAVSVAGARSLGVNTSAALATVGASLSRSGGTNASTGNFIRRDRRGPERQSKVLNSRGET